MQSLTCYFFLIGRRRQSYRSTESLDAELITAQKSLREQDFWNTQNTAQKSCTSEGLIGVRIAKPRVLCVCAWLSGVVL